MDTCKKSDELTLPENCELPTIDGLITIDAKTNYCGVEYNSKDKNEGAMVMFDNWWGAQINQYGINVHYYVNTFNDDRENQGDWLYKEHPTHRFFGPTTIKIAVKLDEQAAILTQSGFDAQEEITGYIHIKNHYRSFLEQEESIGEILFPEVEQPFTDEQLEDIQEFVEPKSDDVICLYEYGCSRPGKRNPLYFELTYVTDQDISEINQLGGHYVYKIVARRLDYSFENGLPDNASPYNQHEGIHYGNIAGDDDIVYDSEGTPDKNIRSDGRLEDYTSDADTDSKDIFDNDKNNTDIFGDYY